MVSEAQTKNRIAFALFVLLVLLGGFFTWRARAGELGVIQERIGNDETQIESYSRIIARRQILLDQYRLLSARYLQHQTTVAGMETSFTRLLADVCRTNHVTIVGVNYGDINGSAPPPPAPKVDQNGQALQTLPTSSASGPPSDLGANHAGDPKVHWPLIPAQLFTRVPATVLIKGDWRNLIAAVQDIPRRNMLIVVANPEVKRMDSGALSLSFEAQILAPAVTVIDK